MTLAALFERLRKSKFRSSFRLTSNERAYLDRIGWEGIRKQAVRLMVDRLSQPLPLRDGRQTPTHGHPVFVAQHATATCCRECLRKWHGIAEGRALSDSEIENIADAIMEWLRRQNPVLDKPSRSNSTSKSQLSLF